MLVSYVPPSSPFILPSMVAVSQQRYETDILRENVILGNEALFKCSIPSFIVDFVSVVSWEDSEANTWHYGPSNFGNWQKYDASCAVKNAVQ
jgi:hypothetical protein